MAALKAFSLLSLTVSVTLLALYSMRRYLAAYEAGALLAQNLQGEGEIEDGSLRALTSLNKIGLAFLPLICRLEADNKLGISDKLSAWNRQLFKAGIRPALSPHHLLSLLLASGSICGVLGAVIFYLFLSGLAGALLLGLPIGAGAGFYLPLLILNRIADHRAKLIEKQLPFAIEFMLLTLEANASFPAAMQEYCVQFSDSPLAHEFKFILRSIGHGTRLQDALSQMSLRIDLECLTSFTQAVITGYEMGQPVREILKLQADAVRQHRFKMAEEIAKTAGVKANFPLFVVMIAVFLLIVGPLVIIMSRSF